LDTYGAINNVHLALDSEGNVIISSTTRSSNFPTYLPVEGDTEIQRNTGAYNEQDPTDISITKISRTGEVAWSRLIKGSESEISSSILIDQNDNIIVSGVTMSADYQLVNSPTPRTSQNSEVNGVNMRITPDGDLVLSSYLVIEETISPFSLPVVGMILTLFSLGGIMTYLVRSFKYGDREIIGISGNVDKIIAPIFEAKSSLVYLFLSQDVFKDKSIAEVFDSEVPKEIYEFKFLMNPIRLAMTKLLYENIKFTTSELKEQLGLSWNDLNNNLNAMKKKNHIHIEQHFVDGRVQQFVSLQPATITQFKFLKEMLVDFLTKSQNIDKYLEVAMGVKSAGSQEKLYPI
ncbi:MAG: hypothetical protein ACXAD7_27530, partial [Candidatus Kariarchaeaceae archaeon]|jgi:DNA-binding MarR family transcriptional regulator